MISDTVLIVAEDFPRLSAERVGRALASGLRGTGRDLAVDALEIGARERWSSDERAMRLRSARAVVLAAPRLDERTLASSTAFEVATSARQAGVPAYAVTAHNALDLFDARMLDLQVILQAATPRALASAGRKLAGLV